MTKSKRIGHWRTNAQGTTTWVTEHTLERTIYTFSKDGTNRFVNGQKLLETYCKYCYQKVFFVSLNEKQKYFNNNSEPLISHQCRVKDNKKEINKKPIRTKKFLNESDVAALYQRGKELRRKQEKNQNKFAEEKAKIKKHQERIKYKSDRFIRHEILKIFYISGTKKQNNRLSKLKLENVNDYLPRIIYNEVKPFLVENLDKSFPFLHLNITAKEIKKTKIRMHTLLSNVQKYSKMKKNQKHENIFSEKLLKLIEYLEKIVVYFSEAEVLLNEQKVLSKSVEVEQKEFSEKIQKEIKAKEAAKVKKLEAKNAKLAANAAKVIVVKKKKFTDN